MGNRRKIREEGRLLVSVLVGDGEKKALLDAICISGENKRFCKFHRLKFEDFLRSL